jgi:hypothetical protein
VASIARPPGLQLPIEDSSVNALLASRIEALEILLNDRIINHVARVEALCNSEVVRLDNTRMAEVKRWEETRDLDQKALLLVTDANRDHFERLNHEAARVAQIQSTYLLKDAFDVFAKGSEDSSIAYREQQRQQFEQYRTERAIERRNDADDLTAKLDRQRQERISEKTEERDRATAQNRVIQIALVGWALTVAVMLFQTFYTPHRDPPPLPIAAVAPVAPVAPVLPLAPVK